ncbi:hypothetical protein [Pseudomonas sp. TH31]|uniref:hypothetical protein n=1 Tax=Pseudomonas sp. TH31 TaxID=2796396 RepID=UPI001913E404|nr:hypothetical protein [Pseudomonas sp. TH31]MBK5415243.1 hypothetical protein [Pseudomonas sp. TH31]
MQLSDAAVITEVEGIRDANIKLTEGWKLLAITTRASPADKNDYTYFILGRPAKDEKPEKPPMKISAAALAQANQPR